MPPKLQCIIQQKYQFKAARILIGNLKHYLNNDSRLRLTCGPLYAGHANDNGLQLEAVVIGKAAADFRPRYACDAP